MRVSLACLSPVLLVLAVSCSSSQPPAPARAPAPPRTTTNTAPLSTDLRETADPDNVIHTIIVENAKIVSTARADIPKEAISTKAFERKDEPAPDVRPPGKLHPLVQKWMASSTEASKSMPVVITFRDTTPIPRFPEPAIGEPRDSDTNKRVLARNAELIEGLRAARTRSREAAEKSLAAMGGKITEQFWLIPAYEVVMPVGSLRELVQQDDILYIEPVQTEDMPPQNGNNADDVDDGRARINSDPYFNLGQTGGFIGLLDTGIRNTHVQFNGPSHIAFLRDCVNGGNDCNTGVLNTADDCWNHGTSSAGIITGNAVQGAAFRGVTAITLDSFKVYPSTFNGTQCTGGLSTTAAVRGFQQAIAVADRVIVAEMQGSGDHTSSISVAADNAFDAGAVIIAANGNNGPNASTVNTPANAHRVLGIGNFDVQTQAQITSQSRGPTSDGRFKPDVQAPTNTETASTGCPFGVSCAQSNTALRVFGGTSGATPYGAGAAALVRNFLRGGTGVIEPGFVYAFLIMSGQVTAFNNITGAGPIRLPVNGTFAIGKVTVTNNGTVNIPFSVGGAPNRVDAAIWWPETTPQAHNDVDLSLIRPNGTTAGSSTSVGSVYERAGTGTSIATGTWTVRIRGFSVPASPQTVFFAVAAHQQ